MSEMKDDDFSAVAWPGFVDILSTVIMMFLFFIMIVSIVMYVMSMEYKKEVETTTASKMQDQMEEELKKIMEKINAGEITLEQIKNASKNQQQNETLTVENIELKNELKNADSVIDQIKADMASGLNQETQITEDGYFVILFEKNDISISPDTEKTLQAYAENIARTAGVPLRELGVEIVSGDNPNSPTISVARELGLARALNIRNVFIKGTTDPEKISILYAPAKSIQDSYNWIKVRVSKE
ncbi:MAG: hypothetical protein WC043_08090 [Pseudobdellovibrionaceae bacterium]